MNRTAGVILHSKFLSRPMIDNLQTDEHSADPLGLPRHDAHRTAAAREAVEILASRFLEEMRTGRGPSVDEYAVRFPAHAAEIRRLFPLVAAMEGWKAEKAKRSQGITLPAAFPLDRLGDCRMVREIGRGGMGVVFEAYQEPPGRRVAVKILPWQHAPDSPWREQFAHEARLAARLRHANIVPVYHYGEQAGFSYYVMPFIVGVGLDWVIQRLAQPGGVVCADDIRRTRTALSGNAIPSASEVFAGHPAGVPKGASAFPEQAHARLPVDARIDASKAAQVGTRQFARGAWKKIAKIGVQVAAALRYAHRKGLLHRDIKPANILLDADGVVWITDFGLARQISSVEDSPEIVGTLRYMSPEHLVGSADERSDVYSLGITLHELCTLQPAFQARTKAQLKQAICRGELIPPRTVDARLPGDLEAVIFKAAAADPQHRYQSADELKLDLLRFLNGQRVSAALRRR